MRRLLAVAVVAVLAVAIPTAASAESRNSVPTTTENVKSAGISLRCPAAWFVTTPTKAGLDSLLAVLAKKNPNLVAQLSSVDLSTYKFYAISLVDGSSVAASVVRGGGSPGSVAEWRDNLRMAGNLPTGATLISTKAVKVSGKPAYRADLTLPVVAPAGTTIVLHEALLWVLVRGNADSGDATLVEASVVDSPAGTSTINSILASVRHL